MGKAGKGYDDRRGRRDKWDESWGGSGDGGRDSFSGRDDYSRPSFPERTAPAAPIGGAGEDVTGVVKFYNSQKGFGFVTVDSIGKDVFLHATALNGESDDIPEGATITCSIKPDPRRAGSMVVASVTSIDRSTGAAPVRRPASRPIGGDKRTDVGVLEFYNEDKGFGFLKLASGVSVFVHATVGQRANIELTEGDRYEVDHVEGEKGPRAVGIREA